MILSPYGDKCLSIYFGNDAWYHTCELLLGAIHAFILVPQSTTSTNGYRNNFRMFLYVYICINTLYLHIPENILAIAAIKKLSITPGPAIDLATMPATKYMPVPQHEPTPNDVRSNVVRHFCEIELNIFHNVLDNHRYLFIIIYSYIYNIEFTVNFGFVLRGSSACTVRKSFVRINLENKVMPVPPPGIGNENFIFGICNRIKKMKLQLIIIVIMIIIILQDGNRINQS